MFNIPPPEQRKDHTAVVFGHFSDGGNYFLIHKWYLSDTAPSFEELRAINENAILRGDFYFFYPANGEYGQVVSDKNSHINFCRISSDNTLTVIKPQYYCEAQITILKTGFTIKHVLYNGFERNECFNYMKKFLRPNVDPKISDSEEIELLAQISIFADDVCLSKTIHKRTMLSEWNLDPLTKSQHNDSN